MRDKVILLLTVFILCVTATLSTDWKYGGCVAPDECVTGSSAIERSNPESTILSGNGLVLSRNDDGFETEGWVVSFDVYIKNGRNMNVIGIFRQISHNKYELLGKKIFRERHSGFRRIFMDTTDFIHVQPGDRVGLLFSNELAIHYDDMETCNNKTLFLENASLLTGVGDQVTLKEISNCFVLSLQANLYCPNSELKLPGNLDHPCYVEPVDECATNNGGCSHNCKDTRKSFICSCRDTFVLQPDKASCECEENFAISKDGSVCEVDKCAKNNGGCEQVCIRDGSKHECDCDEGFLLEDDGKSCKEYDPLPDSLIMLQNVKPKWERVCYNLDLQGASEIRLLHDADNDIMVKGKIKKSSNDENYYFKKIIFERGNTKFVFSYDSVVLNGKKLDWDNLPETEGDYHIGQRRPGEAITVRFNPVRAKVVFLFEKSIEFKTKTPRIDFAVLRKQGLSDNVVGVIGSYFKDDFGTVGSPSKKYEEEGKFNFAGSNRDVISLRHRNPRNGRSMQCWEIKEDLEISTQDILS